MSFFFRSFSLLVRVFFFLFLYDIVVQFCRRRRRRRRRQLVLLLSSSSSALHNNSIFVVGVVACLEIDLDDTITFVGQYHHHHHHDDENENDENDANANANDDDGCHHKPALDVVEEHVVQRLEDTGLVTFDDADDIISKTTERGKTVVQKLKLLRAETTKTTRRKKKDEEQREKWKRKIRKTTRS